MQNDKKKSTNPEHEKKLEEKLEAFAKKLDVLFDVASSDALHKMQGDVRKERNLTKKRALEEDLRFYEDQRDMKRRKLTIVGVDKNLASRGRKEGRRKVEKEITTRACVRGDKKNKELGTPLLQVRVVFFCCCFFFIISYNHITF